ncbi:MAG: hypothetical protein HY299_01570 [Verrucomicrobia bacterium]|nr:hypothetical protein [Verrucomicrobiota bacterium]
MIGLVLGWTLAGHAGEASPRVRAVRVPVDGKVIKAQIGADGAIHVLVDSTNGPLYLLSRDHGRVFSEPIAVVDSAARKPGLNFSSWDLAVGKDNRAHVAMASNAWKLKLPEEEWGFFYASLAPNAKAFSPTRNINRKPSEGFSLAAGGSGSVTAGFLSGKLFAMVSNDGGETFAASAELNPEWNPCDCCTTSVAYGADGRLALLYREETGNERDMYVVLWDQARGDKLLRKRLSGESWKINGCPMTYFTIAPCAKGYLAAWPTKGEIYFARLDKDGAVLPPGEIKTPGTSGMRTGVLALGAPDGTALVAWKAKSELGWQIYDAKGRPKGSPGSEKSRGDGAAGVPLPDGTFILFP